MAVHEAADAIIRAKLVPEQSIPSVAAMLAANADDLNSKLRGSLLRLNKSAARASRWRTGRGDADGAELETLCRAWSQPSTFR